MNRRTLVLASLILGLAAASALAGPAQKPGKFLIIGMGSAPDLVTVRGLEAAKRADMFLLENAEDQKAWGKIIGKKPVLIVPHMARVFFGIDPSTIADPEKRALAQRNEKIRNDLVDKVKQAVAAGKTVAFLQWGDPMVYGSLFLFEMMPPEVPREIIPGVGAFQSGAAALQRSPVFGFDTSSVILTMADWPGRADVNEKLMALNTNMVFYTMHLDYPALFEKLAKAYPPETPVAAVCFAGDPKMQRVIRSTVGKFLTEVDFAHLPAEMHTLFVGKFLTAGQGRKDGVSHGKEFIEKMHGDGGSPEGQCHKQP